MNFFAEIDAQVATLRALLGEDAAAADLPAILRGLSDDQLVEAMRASASLSRCVDKATALGAGETAADAAVRELLEETGLHGRVVRALGTVDYDLAPMRDEIARRHFFVMVASDADTSAVWSAGENDPSDGSGTHHTWTCRWIPLVQAHVLAGGLSAKLGEAVRPA